MSTQTSRLPQTIQAQIATVYPVTNHEGWFTTADLDMAPEDAHRALLNLRREGMVEQSTEKYDAGRGHYYHEYRWVGNARALVEDYYEQMDKLPCGCRIHIPSGRDDRPGHISCKYCGREYIEVFFEELVRDAF